MKRRVGAAVRQREQPRQDEAAQERGSLDHRSKQLRRLKSPGIPHSTKPFPVPRCRCFCSSLFCQVGVQLLRQQYERASVLTLDEPSRTSSPKQRLRKRLGFPDWGSGKGHEEQLPPPRLSGCCRLGQETFPGAAGNGRDAPIPDPRAARSRTGRFGCLPRHPAQRMKSRLLQRWTFQIGDYPATQEFCARGRKKCRVRRLFRDLSHRQARHDVAAEGKQQRDRR